MQSLPPRATAPQWLVIVVAVVVVAGIFFRFYHLDRKVFWDDEAMGTVHMLGYTEAQVVEASPQFTTAADAQRFLRPPAQLRLGDTVHALATEDPQHAPGYYFIERIWVQLLGSSPAADRSLSAAFGVILLPCVYWLAAELFGSSIIGLLAVALVAVSPLYVLYAQEAREYMLWLVAVTLQGLAFLRAVRTNDVGLFVAYGLVTALGLYIYPLTGLVAIGLAVYLFLRERGRFTRPLVACLLANVTALAAFVPWLHVALASAGLVRGMSGIATRKVSPTAFLTIAGRDLRSPFVDIGVFRYGPLSSTLINLVLTVIVVALVIVAFRALIRNWPFAVWGFIAIGLCLSVAPLALKGQFIIQTRYFFPLLLGVQLSVAALLAGAIFARSAGDSMRRAATAAFFVLIAGEVLSCAISSPAETWWNKDYANSRAVARAIAGAPRPILVSDSYAARTLALSMYLDPATPVRVNLQCEQCTIQLPPRADLMNTSGYDTVFYLQVPDAARREHVRWIDPRPFPPKRDPLNLFLFV
jgi:uncharacterized membrane protein